MKLKPKIDSVEIKYGGISDIEDILFKLIDELTEAYFSDVRLGYRGRGNPVPLVYNGIKITDKEISTWGGGGITGYVTEDDEFCIIYDIPTWIKLCGYYLFHYRELSEDHLMALYRRW